MSIPTDEDNAADRLKFFEERVGRVEHFNIRELVIKETDDIQLVTIFGVRFAIEYFRSIATGPIDPNLAFRIIAREDGVVTLQTLDLAQSTRAFEERIAELEGRVARKTALINDLVALQLEKKEKFEEDDP